MVRKSRKTQNQNSEGNKNWIPPVSYLRRILFMPGQFGLNLTQEAHIPKPQHGATSFFDRVDAEIVKRSNVDKVHQRILSDDSRGPMLSPPRAAKPAARLLRSSWPPSASFPHSGSPLSRGRRPPGPPRRDATQESPLPISPDHPRAPPHQSRFLPREVR